MKNITVNKLAELLSARIVNLADGEREITCGYAGDLLSFVMGKAPQNSAWFTVMTNINVCAVAVLADVAAVVICEDSEPMDGVKEKAAQQGVNILVTNLDVFSAIERLLNES